MEDLKEGHFNCQIYIWYFTMKHGNKITNSVKICTGWFRTSWNWRRHHQQYQPKRFKKIFQEEILSHVARETSHYTKCSHKIRGGQCCLRQSIWISIWSCLKYLNFRLLIISKVKANPPITCFLEKYLLIIFKSLWLSSLTPRPPGDGR